MGLLLLGLGLFSSSAVAQPPRPPLSPSVRPLETPSLPPPANPSLNLDRSNATTASLAATSEQFVDLIAAGKFEQARRLLNPVLQQGWTTAQMRQNWQSLQTIIGSYKGRSNTQVVDGNLVLIDLEFENATDNLLIIFDDQQQIQGVDFPLQVPRV